MALRQGAAGEDYNIGTGGEASSIAVADTVLRLLAKPRSLKEFVADRPGHDRRYAVDTAKIKRELEWKQRESFATGIRRTVEWYLANPEWIAEVTSGEYRRWISANYDLRGSKA